jgi:hypothetical protein
MITQESAAAEPVVDLRGSNLRNWSSGVLSAPLLDERANIRDEQSLRYQ